MIRGSSVAVRTACAWVTLLLGALLLAAPLRAQSGTMVGAYVGTVVESVNYSWVAVSTSAEHLEKYTTGTAGLAVRIPVFEAWSLHINPYYAQRNYPLQAMGANGSQKYRLEVGEVERIGVPMALAWHIGQTQVLRPWIAAGVEFGVNVGSTMVRIVEQKTMPEPLYNAVRYHTLPLNQLYGAGVVQAGVDIAAGERWLVTLGGAYAVEFSAPVDDALFTWQAPRYWNVRLGVLHEIPF